MGEVSHHANRRAAHAQPSKPGFVEIFVADGLTADQMIGKIALEAGAAACLDDVRLVGIRPEYRGHTMVFRTGGG
ncbi:hypothetical protein [Glutamicibacter sp. V16R2B1]|uniref:hypothetical protein n=1 Tax=Glutamicibacter sp. V16R2B1 TaxID=2036207 RepID=UPI0010FED97C|nr:hypothetical protein [Glutamicibacter sp. V16R2B1]MCK9901357.1 hypothetical protein [Frankia sp. Cpl3]TLK48001.1 hypothetical protein FDN03_15410 [Glutamicibacter sp. V16R2B1]